MTKPQKLSRTQIARRLTREWKAMLQENRLNSSPDALKRFKNARDVRPETLVVAGMTLGLGMLIQDFGTAFASGAKIETEEQLQAALRMIKEVSNQMPTVLRKAMKQLRADLPRRGGPGRQPKLKPNEASQMCDQIATFIRQNNNLKQALQKASELTLPLLGKKVSPRTLQKAWNNRGEEVISNRAD